MTIVVSEPKNSPRRPRNSSLKAASTSFLSPRHVSAGGQPYKHVKKRRTSSRHGGITQFHRVQGVGSTNAGAGSAALDLTAPPHVGFNETFVARVRVSIPHLVDSDTGGLVPMAVVSPVALEQSCSSSITRESPSVTRAISPLDPISNQLSLQKGLGNCLKLHIGEIPPSNRRAKTMIKAKILLQAQLCPANNSTLNRLLDDLKSKILPIGLHEIGFSLHAVVLCVTTGRVVSDPCPKCRDRDVEARAKEFKRNSLRKTQHIKKHTEDTEGTYRVPIIVFNRRGRSIICDGDGFTVIFGISCYCKHHGEKEGFIVEFTLKDSEGCVITSGVTNPIMIKDDHKNNTKRKGKDTASVKKNASRTQLERDLSVGSSSHVQSPVDDGYLHSLLNEDHARHLGGKEPRDSMVYTQLHPPPYTPFIASSGYPEDYGLNSSQSSMIEPPSQSGTSLHISLGAPGPHPTPYLTQSYGYSSIQYETLSLTHCSDMGPMGYYSPPPMTSPVVSAQTSASAGTLGPLNEFEEDISVDYGYGMVPGSLNEFGLDYSYGEDTPMPVMSPADSYDP